MKLKLSKKDKERLDAALVQALKNTEAYRERYQEATRIPWSLWFERMTI